MSLPQRARILFVKQDGFPAEDGLRLAQSLAYLPFLRKAPHAYSTKAAADGPECLNISSGKSTAPRPAARRRDEIHPAGPTNGRIPDRAAGVLGEALRATEVIPARRQSAVFRRRVLTFKFHRWFLSVAVKICGELESLLRVGN